MNFGPRKMQMSREAIPAIENLAHYDRTLSSPADREPLTSTRSPGWAISSSSAPASSGVPTA